MTIKYITKDLYIVKGRINSRYFTGIGQSVTEALEKAFDDHYQYVRVLFSSNNNSAIGNIPRGYEHYCD